MTHTITADEPSNEPELTLDKVAEIAERLMQSRPMVYYVTSDFIERGFMTVIKATLRNPQYVIIHTEDVGKVKQTYPHVNWQPLPRGLAE